MPLDMLARKLALRSITYGLYVLTATDGTEIAATVINWASQASFDPGLLMVALRGSSPHREMVERTGVFALNTLAEGQFPIGEAFFHESVVEGDCLNGYRFERGPETGCPLLVDLPYWMEGRVTDKIARGDHHVFVAELVGAGVRDESAVPLVLRSTGMNYGG